MAARFRNSAVLAALVLFAGCASQAPPSGGPPDRTPPRVVSTLPADDSVMVGTDTVVEILFDEHMDRPSVERSLFVSPRPASDPRFRWRGRRLKVDVGALEPNRTYRVSVGAESRDAYRNKMTSSFDFTFSTGRTIHRGRVMGRVAGGGNLPVLVAAFPIDGADPDPTDRAPYLTQAGADGRFAFPGLSAGRYRVYGYEDADGDDAYDAGIELLAVPPEDAVLDGGDGTAAVRTMRLAPRDTIPPRVDAVRTVDATHLRIKFDEAVVLPVSVAVRGDGRDLPVRAVHLGATDSSVVFVVTEAQREGADYSVRVGQVADTRGNAAADTTLTVRGDGRRDTRGPRLAATRPAVGATVFPDDPLVLTFDEAVRPAADGSVWTVSDSTLAPAGAVEWRSANVLVFRPEPPLPPGPVSVGIRLAAIRDVAGNPGAEPATLAFSVVELGALGSVTGGVVPKHAAIRVNARPVAEVTPAASTTVAPGDTTFTLSGLIPGAYVIGGFVDRDGDGRWSPGQARPFSPAEPVLTTSDTLDVRSRWETVVERPLADTVEKETEENP